MPMTIHELDENTISGLFSTLGGPLTAITDPSSDTINYYQFTDYSQATAFFFRSERNFIAQPKCDLNFTTTAQQGFAYSVNDWQNVEITGQFFILKRPTAVSSGTLALEARRGAVGSSSPCCSVSSYGSSIVTSAQADLEGRVGLFKRGHSDKTVLLPFFLGSAAGLSSFYQKWFGFKFVVRNVTVGTNEEVHVEVYLSPSDQPSDLENWILVYKQIDYKGRNWTNIGTACSASTPDQPVTWGSALSLFTGTAGMEYRFKNLSIREIESFDEQVENPPGGSDPGGDPTPEPPDTEPPDVPTPPTPTIIQKRLTIKREVLNNAFCQCDGVPDGGAPGGGGDPGGGGTGGGGGGTGGGGGGGGAGGSLRTIYNVTRTSSTGFSRMASVSSNRGDYFLRYGQIVDQPDSVFIGEIIGRIEVFIAEEDRPRGGSGGGVHLRIRKGTDDSIAAELLPVINEDDIHDAGNTFTFDLLSNTYPIALNDKILFEYDGGGSSDYVKIFRRSSQPATGSKTVHRNNSQDAGEYSTSNNDVCMRVYAISGTFSADTSDP